MVGALLNVEFCCFLLPLPFRGGGRGVGALCGRLQCLARRPHPRLLPGRGGEQNEGQRSLPHGLMFRTALPDDLVIPTPPDQRRRRGFVRRHWRGILGVVALIVAITLGWLLITAPLGRALEPRREPALVLLAADGHAIARRGDYKEAPVSIAELPKYVPGALIAIEDRRFYSHWGIDPRGIARALWSDVRGRPVQGGSTLTQQLAKTSFLTGDRTLKRKLQEVIIAFWLEARLSKDEILSRYLSSVYYGDGAYGLRAAARTYFDKDPKGLTLGEAAMLAGLVQAPSRLAPSRHLAEARDRADLVLDAMVDTGQISRARADAAVPARYRPGRSAVPAGSYFADWVLPQARAASDAAARDEGAHYGETVVRTTLDRALQREAERDVADALRAARGQGVTQAALVAMRPDGRVVAMVGGTGYATTPFNRATQSLRQPGSAFKLFVYLAALDAGADPQSIVEDKPLTIGSWSPHNDDGRYRGPVPLITAFAASSNVAAARLTQQVGTAAVIGEARRLGITAPLDDNPTIALGTSGVSLLELTQAYAAVAAGRHPIRATGLAEPRQGLAATLARTISAVRPWPSRRPMLELLASAVRNGTGTAARLPVVAYGKTGTTQEHRDALFVGFAGNLVVGVWVGNDDNTPMRGVVGGSVPARLWHRFMVAALTRDGTLRPAPREPGLGGILDAIGGPGLSDAATVVGDVVQGVGDAATAVRELSRDQRGPPPDAPEPPSAR